MMFRLILVSVLSACLAGPKFESPVNILRRYVKMFNTYDPCLEYENPDVIDQDIEMKCIGAFNYMDRLPAGDLPLYCLLSQRTQSPSCRNFRGKMRCMVTAKHTIIARLMGPSTIHTQIMVMPVPLAACAETVGVGIPSSENIHAALRKNAFQE
nr:PREDICTED: uncharacterized protein LOC109044088 [Bemisia tabaci]